MEMKKLIEEITVHTALLNELLQVLERETTEMSNIDITAMNLANQAKDGLMARIAEHSQHLQRAASALAGREGFTGSVSLGKLAEHFERKGSRELLTRQRQICYAAEQVQLAATLNHGIAERFASTVTMSLTLISRLLNQSNVYGASGGYQQRPTGAVIINREA